MCTNLVFGIGDTAVALTLSGKLRFGDIVTTYTEWANQPVEEGTPDPLFQDGGLASTLQIINQSGRLPNKDGLGFGDGTPLPVHLTPQGDAIYTGTAPITLTGSKDGNHPLAGIRLGYARLELSSAGLSAFDAYVLLPTGAGYTLTSTSRRYGSRWPLGRVSLDSSLAPSTPLSLRATDLGASELWLHVDGFPVVLRAPTLHWDPSGGTFEAPNGAWEFSRAARQTALDQLLAARNAGAAIRGDVSRLSNDLLFRNPGSAQGAILRTDSRGIARWDARIPLGPTAYLTHFPGASLSALAGVAEVREGEIVPSLSSVSLGSSVLQFYSPNCPEPECSTLQSPLSGLSFTADEGGATLTADGGLVAMGTVDPTTLAWGNAGSGVFTHQAGPFTRGNLLIAGFRLSGATPTVRSDSLPGKLLLSGFSTTGLAEEAERTDTEGYTRGLTDYPGLNFRADGAQSGESILGGTSTGSYDLAARSKYYIRFPGVSGVHQASSFRRQLKLLDFPTSLTGLSLAVMDNANTDSRTSGQVHVPGPSDAPIGPSGFDLSFQRLRFGCQGNPGPAVLASQNTTKQLAYWATSFEPLTVAFESAKSATPCSVSKTGFLVVGAQVPLPLVRGPVVGILAFRSDGDLATTADGSPVDSRLRLPPTLPIAGPGNSQYLLTGLRHAYFNRWSQPDRPTDGFVNFFGSLDVPFFKDIRIQAQVQPGIGVLGMALMGGWHSESDRSNSPLEAWLEGSDSPFTKKSFDAANRGFPAGISLASYRDPDSPAFNPRGEQDWAGILHLDELLQWRSAELRFRDDQKLPSRSERTLIFQVERRVKTLNAKGAELSFGLEPSLPRISPNQLLFESLDQATGLHPALEQALNNVTGEIRDRTGIARAANQLDRLTGIHPDSLLRPAFQTALRPLARSLLQILQPAYESAVRSAAEKGQDAIGQAESARQKVCALFDVSQGAFTPVFRDFTQGTELVRGLAGEVEHSLQDVEDGIQEILDVLRSQDVPGSIPPRKERRVITELARRLATPERLGPYGSALGTGFAGNLADSMQREYLPQAEQAFADLERQVTEILAQIQAFHAQFQTVSGPAVASLDEILSESGEVQAWFGSISNAVCQSFALPTSVPGGWFREISADQAEERLLTAIQDEFLRRLFASRSTLLLRTAFSPARGIFRGALDELFAELNDMIRRGVDEQLKRLGLPLTDAEVTRFLDSLEQVARGTRIRGHARINNDSLEDLRLDGHFSFGLYGITPGGSQEGLEFDAWCEIHQYRSDSPAEGCRPAGTASATVELGTRFAPGGGFAQGMQVGLQARASFHNQELLGVSGGILLSGSKQIAGASVTDPALTFHFGKEGNYLGGLASMSLHDFSAGGTLFVGEACNLAQLTFVDPDLLKVLQHHGVDVTQRIAGFWVRADGSFPLERLLPVPPLGCLLHLEGRGGIGYYLLVFKNSPFTATAGVLVREGVSGQIYCALTGTGEITLLEGVSLASILDGSGPYVIGHGFIEGKVLGFKRRKDFEFNARLIRRGNGFDAEFHLPQLE